MAVTSQTRKIAESFQKYVKYGDKAEIGIYTKEQLEVADNDLAWRDENTGYRLALKKRIEDLEKTSERKYNSYVRTVSYVVGLAIAVIAVIASIKYI